MRKFLMLNATQFDSETEVLDDLRAKLATWIFVARTNDEPSIDVGLSYQKREERSSSGLHLYVLQVNVQNTSKVTLPEVEFELEFPKLFLPNNREFNPNEERKNIATDTHRFFRGRSSIDLRPGARTSFQPLNLEYQVADELFMRTSQRSRLCR